MRAAERERENGGGGDGDGIDAGGIGGEQGIVSVDVGNTYREQAAKGVQNCSAQTVRD